MNKEIWEDQKKFNKLFFKDQNLVLSQLSLKDRIKWAKEFFFHINKELTDLINCLPNWKMHYQHDDQHEFIKSNLKEEYVDAFKYFMGLGQVLGITYHDIENVYQEKSNVVKQKYAQNRKLDQLRDHQIVIFDIDGVINNYPDCFLDWLKRSKKMCFKDMHHLHEKLDTKSYEDLKKQYRLSGAKKNQPINPDTLKVMKELKRAHETIILFTTRPVGLYKVIYSDTLQWLKKNKIPFDAIFWSDYQQKDDIYKLGFDIKFIVEDSLQNAKLFNHEGYKVFLINNKYNQDDHYEHENLFRINSPLEILK